MLSRQLYQFRRFDLKQIPGSKRRQALELQIRQWSPYGHTGHVATWQGDSALVWYWNGALVEEKMIEAGYDPKKTPIIPETALYPIQESGMRLLKCREGTEGQFWENGMLVQSRWWKETPGIEEWIALQRDIGLQPDFSEPEAVALPLLGNSWAQLSSTSNYVDLGLKIERYSYAAIFFLLTLTTFWYGSAMLKAGSAVKRLQAAYDASSRNITPLLDSRNQAISALSRIDELMKLYPYPDQLYLMEKVGRALPRNGTYLTEWDFHDGKLRIALASEKAPLSATFFINALQLAGPFNNVNALPGTGAKSLSLQMDVVPSHA